MRLRTSATPSPAPAARIASVESVKECISGSRTPRNPAALSHSRQPCDARSLDRPQRGGDGVDVRERSGGRVGKRAAFRRQVNAAGVALKEFDSKASLQCPDVVTHSARCQIQLFGSMGEALVARRDSKNAKGRKGSWT